MPTNIKRGNLTGVPVFPMKYWVYSRAVNGRISPINAACPMISVTATENLKMILRENGWI